AWAADMVQQNPGFFGKLAKLQSPQYLWIGCSDSRVPANQITGLAPGEVFVHRNVSNLVIHTDMNCLSVLQYAIDYLKVRHVIVCGHYGCGGVRASLEKTPHGLIDNWLRHIRDVYGKSRAELDAIADPDRKMNRLCELNVIEQVRNVCKTTVIQDAWARGQRVTVHGWIYGIEDGLLKDLEHSYDSQDEMDERNSG
ncbi:MAG TPA: carbonate dehydratase, partial [Fibrobacteria bacterium]|nr:carbonate dehydratase [Fibrobacteria bacterium]